jgi:hypothetical protein
VDGTLPQGSDIREKQQKDALSMAAFNCQNRKQSIEFLLALFSQKV